MSAVWGWLVASFFTLMVGLAMAEICSSYPTSGGLYYWAARLGGKHRVFASWLAGASRRYARCLALLTRKCA